MRYPRTRGWRRRETVRKTIVIDIIMASLTETNFTTLFQSLGFFPFVLQSVLSLFQFAWSCSANKQVEFSFERGKKSLCSKTRSLPVLKTMFIHRNRRRETKLGFSVSSSVEMVLYLFLAMTLDLQTRENTCILIALIGLLSRANIHKNKTNQISNARAKEIKSVSFCDQ